MSITASQILATDPQAAAPSQPPADTPSAQQAPGAAAPSQDDRVSPKLQMLIKRERAALEAERKSKDFERTLAEREAKVKEFESVRENPLKVLEMLGLSLEQLNMLVANDGKAPPEMALQQVQSRLDDFEKRQEAEKQALTEKQKQEEQKAQAQAIEKFQGQIAEFLKERSERYELLAFHFPDDSGKSIIYDVVNQHYEDTLKAATDKALAEDPDADVSQIKGEVLSLEKAADKCELHLEQKYKNVFELKKVGAFLASRQAPKKTPVTKPQTQIQSQTPKTLTNALAASPTPSAPTGRILTDAERALKAINFAKGLRAA